MKRLQLGLLGCLLAVLGLSASACTSVRNGLGTRDGVCFASLPAARQVVGPDPSFAGVRYLSGRAVARDLENITPGPRSSLPEQLTDVGRRSTCLVAYRGSVPPRVLKAGWRPEPGPYSFTIVVVRQSDQKVLAVLLLPKTPIRFAHLS